MTGKELKSLRRSAKMTQATLAKIAMVSVRTVQNWEAGLYPIPAYRERLFDYLKERHEGRKTK